MIRSLPSICGCLAFVYLAIPFPHVKSPRPVAASTLPNDEAANQDVDYFIYEISLSDEREANRIYERLLDSEDIAFSDIAAIVSQADTNVNGGLVGKFSSTTLREKFGEDQALEFEKKDDGTMHKPKQFISGWVIYSVSKESNKPPPIFVPIPVTPRFVCRWLAWIPHACQRN